jgi:hypothetical protein
VILENKKKKSKVQVSRNTPHDIGSLACHDVHATLHEYGRKSIVEEICECKFLSESQGIRLLYFFVQIGSHASRTPLSITNFGQCHASLGPLSNLQAVTQVPKLPKKCKKDEILGSNVEISKASRKNSAAAEMSNR